jgi:hypothetical protein
VKISSRQARIKDLDPATRRSTVAVGLLGWVKYSGSCLLYYFVALNRDGGSLTLGVAGAGALLSAPPLP